MRYEIKGTTMPALEITLNKGEAVYTETTSMSWMSQEIDMATGTRGGLGKIIGRAITGESLFLTTFRSNQDEAKVVFTPDTPGVIVPVELAQGQQIIAQRDAFMTATEDIDVKIHFRKRLGAGLFGGEGFVMQRFEGPGMIFAAIGGEVVEYNLKAGEVLKVNPGYVAMHEPTVDYDISLVRGVRNWIFGGEGIFLTTLRGPGRVWLQTLPISNLAESLMRLMPIPTAQDVNVKGGKEQNT